MELSGQHGKIRGLGSYRIGSWVGHIHALAAVEESVLPLLGFEPLSRPKLI
jgi:hypothetical protein